MPSLVHLPTELLLRIAQYVVAPAEDVSDDDVRHTDVVRDYRSVSRLVRTSRQLCAIAQPVLYHSVGGPGDCGCLIRTLIQRPDLAAMVKDLYIGEDWGLDNSFLPYMADEDNDEVGNGENINSENGNGENGKHWWLSPDDAALFTKVVEKHQICSPEEPSDDHDEAGNEGTTPAIVRPVPKGGLDDLDEDNRLLGILATVAILQCPNVERIMLTTSYWPIAVPKKVDFTFNSFRELYFSRGDTEMNGNAGDDLCWLFQAAPSLVRFTGHMVGEFSAKLSSQSLMDVELTISHIVEKQVEGIFRSFPNLERFSYQAGVATVAESGDAATPRQLVAAMSRCQETLKSIELDWIQSFEMQEGEWGDGCCVETLKNFRNLEEASVHLAGLGVDAGALDADFFKRTYPSSLRRITLAHNSHRVQVLDIACLLAISKTDFPHLKELSVMDYRLEEAEKDIAMHHFNEMGIEMEVTSRIIGYRLDSTELMGSEEEGGECEEDEVDEE